MGWGFVVLRLEGLRRMVESLILGKSGVSEVVHWFWCLVLHWLRLRVIAHASDSVEAKAALWQ